MYPQYLTLHKDEVTLLACKASEGSMQHVALSYAQFAGLNELHKAIRGGADILDSSWECSTRDCKEFGNAVLGKMSELYALYTYAKDPLCGSGAAALFFVAPNLMGNCVTALEKIMENNKGVCWGFVAVSEAEEIQQWLTGVANFFNDSQGVFRV